MTSINLTFFRNFGKQSSHYKSVTQLEYLEEKVVGSIVAVRQNI